MPQLIDASEEILVITPALPGRFEWLASATDRGREKGLLDGIEGRFGLPMTVSTVDGD